MKSLSKFLQHFDFLPEPMSFLGNTLYDYIAFVLFFFLLMLLFKPIIKLSLKIFSKIASQTKTTLDDKIVEHFLKKHHTALVQLEVAIAFFLSIKVLYLSPDIHNIVEAAKIIVITLFVTTCLIDLIKSMIHHKYSDANDPRANSILLIFPIFRVLI